MKAFRLIDQRYEAEALTGEGAFVYGGRWNPPGYPMVYTAANLSLAVLEILVHVEDRRKLQDYRLVRLDVPDNAIEELAVDSLQAGWTARLEVTRKLGRDWLTEARSLALLVPSVVLPDERNLLLNTSHPEMTRIRSGTPEPFRFDPRLL
ncbi:MAG: RES family NAD+ phosphorylase [Trueperaceae bacterium]